MKNEMTKLLTEYSDVKNYILKITDEYYDAMSYDIEGWWNLIEDEEADESDLKALRLQVHAVKSLHMALSCLKYKFS
jgi:hypothetical protein